MMVFEEITQDGTHVTTYCRDKGEAQERTIDAWMNGKAARYYHPADEENAPDFQGPFPPKARDNFGASASWPGHYDSKAR